MQRLHTCISTAVKLLIKRSSNDPVLFDVFKRCLTVSETATALRPFYLAVHPDFFGQFPRERKVNEESLKKLHEYITALHKTGRATPAEIDFYVKDKQQKDFSYVKVKLLSRDIRSTVSTVLKSVDLSLEYLDTIPNVDLASVPKIQWDPTYYHYTGKKNPNKDYYQTKPQHTLTSWLQKNGSKARKRVESCQNTQEEINRIIKELIDTYGLKDIQWASHWSISHYIGCLKSFSRLCSHHPDQIRKVLSGRSLLLSNKTGVSLHGEVVLSSEDVTTDWITLLSSVSAHDAVLERLPYMEKRLSELLGNIRIERMRRRDIIIMAQEYELILNKILNSLRRCQDDVDRYFHGEDLSHLTLTVEQDSAPLTLSPTGKFLVPSSMPGILLVKYISEHKEKAYMILQDMALQIQMEKMVVEQCKTQFQLLSLEKEDNVSPDKMTQSCERLLNDRIYLELGLYRCKLRIAHYYTVMYDGEMCIPWNWASAVS